MAALLALLVCAAGCDSKKASTGNFKAALQKHFDKYPACDRDMSFPEQFTLGRDGKPDDTMGHGRRDKVLKDAGLLTVKEGTVVQPGNLFMPRTQEHVLTYDIAPGHKDEWTTDETNPKHPHLCYAKIKIVSVDNYSEPGDMLGHTISEVDFTYELTHLADWAKAKDVQEAMPEIKTKVDAGAQKSKTMLILTHNGWEPDPSTRL